MNERIEKLALEAGFHMDKYGLFWDQDSNNEGVDLEKFAELIVRECMTICKEHPSRILSNNWNADAVAPDIVHRFEEHFGVEE